MPSDAVLMNEALVQQYDAYQNYCPDCGAEHQQFATPWTWRTHIRKYHPKTWTDLRAKIMKAGGFDV